MKELSLEYLNNRIDRMWELIGIQSNQIDSLQNKLWDKEIEHEQIGFDKCLAYMKNLCTVELGNGGTIETMIQHIELIQRDREVQE